jgi:hypothetical protein
MIQERKKKKTPFDFWRVHARERQNHNEQINNAIRANKREKKRR